MRFFCIYIILIGFAISGFSQTLEEARKLYLNGNYESALPVFERELRSKANDAPLNHWYGVCLYHTGGDLSLAEKHLQVAYKRKIQDSGLYLALIYMQLMEVDKAMFFLNNYEAHLKNKKGKTKTQLANDEKILGETNVLRNRLNELNRMITHVENIVIIDSIIVDKTDLLSTYHLSPYNGSIEYYSTVFDGRNNEGYSTIFMTEKADKIYFSEPDSTGFNNIYSMDLLGEKYGNKKLLFENRFDIDGDIMYPFVMADGVTLIFAAKSSGELDGFNLYITRYNTSTDQYLKPEILNFPFNSNSNDYMYVIDQDKRVGWFASDRNTSKEQVCVYTFIPNDKITFIDNKEVGYLVERAKIKSIKETWVEGADYSNLINLAKQEIVYKQNEKKDFELVVNDNTIYYTREHLKTAKAKNLLEEWIKAKRSLEGIDKELENIRESISQDSNMQIDSRHIRLLETQQQTLETSIEELENEIRMLELNVN